MSTEEQQKDHSPLFELRICSFLKACVWDFVSDLDVVKYAGPAPLRTASKYALLLLDSSYLGYVRPMQFQCASAAHCCESRNYWFVWFVWFDSFKFKPIFKHNCLRANLITVCFMSSSCVASQRPRLHHASRTFVRSPLREMSRQFPRFLANPTPPFKEKELIPGGDKSRSKKKKKKSHDTDAGNNLRVNYLGFWAVSLYTVCLCSPPAFYDSPH